MKFTHLHVHSHYSLLDGLAKIDELIKRAADLQMEALALTDHGTLYGAIEFYQKAKKAGIKPIIGCEFYTAYERMGDKRPNIDDKRYHLTILAENEEGYRNLIKLVTKAHLDGFYYKPRVDRHLLREHAKGLICLSGCPNGEIPTAIRHRKPETAERLLREYQEIFGRENFYLEIMPPENFPEQRAVNDSLAELSKKSGAKLVATNDIHYTKPEDAEAQDILVSVQTGNRVDDDDRLTMKNANLSMRSQEELETVFGNYPEAIASTEEIASRVNFSLELGKNKLPFFPIPAGYDSDSYLRELCLRGLGKKFGNLADERKKQIQERLDFELNVIQQTGFAGYFLIVQDFVNWAKNNNIVVGPGRGSAAGSLASYVLGITNIDPLRYNLLFERFLNPHRISMPDIDMDFADTRRDEVIEYVSRKYGRNHVAQIITFGTMAARAAIRDTGRALGMPYSFCDQIAKMIPFNPTQGQKTGWLKTCLETVAELRDLYERDADAKHLLDSALKLEGVARHASTHACGLVITPKTLDEYVPLQYSVRHGDSKISGENSQVVVSQYEMHAIEDLGLLKMDMLGLRNLTIIEDALQLIHKIHGRRINIDEIPLDDQKALDVFRKGETNGLFQFESQGMKRYLKDLKPTSFEDLIAMVALYRPGPMDLIPSFIRRKHGQEKVVYLHPKLQSILAPTYGVGVYQEQMMQITRELAGFSLGEADTMRRAIGKKITSLLNEQREKLISGMIKNNIDGKTAQAIWELFPPFARYGFNRSHAACYALIAYQTGFLKAYYPTEFMTSLLASEGSDVEKTAFFIEEARNMGIEVLPPDVNESFSNFTRVENCKIRFGLGAVKNVGENIVAAIIGARESGGKFISLTDFAERVQHKDFNKKSIESLAKCGALDVLVERNQMLKNLEMILEFNRESQRTKNNGQSTLFSLAPEIKIAALKLKEFEPSSKRERLAWEKELLGLYVTEHPLEEYKNKFAEKRITPLNRISTDMNNQTILVGGVVSGIKKIITKSGSPMLFVKMEDLTSRTEVLVFPKVLEKNPAVWQEEKILLVRGRVSDKDGLPKILCEDAVEII